MAKVTREIPHIWAQQIERHASAAGVSFNGADLFSYSTPIASFARDKKGEPLKIAAPVTWNDSGSVDENTGQWESGPVRSEVRTLPVVLINRRSYSITTSRHQSNMRAALGYGRDIIAHTFSVDAPRPGYHGRVGAPNDFAGFHAHNLADYAERIINADAAAKKARRPENRAAHAAHAGALIEEAQRYAKAFGVRWNWKGADAHRARIERDAKKAAKAAEALRKERARIAAEREAEQRIRDADDFAAWQAGTLARCPYSYSVDPVTGGVYMRRMGDNLETSQGAIVPWAHAVRVFQFIRKVRETGEAFQANGRTIRVGHYSVDSIDAGGNMRAGCHRFAWAQIEDIAKREGVFEVAPSDDVVTHA